MFVLKRSIVFTRFSNKSRIYQKDILTFRVLWRARVFWRLVGGWYAYRTIFTVLCVLCAPKFGEFFLRYDANWKPIEVHQLISSPPTKMMDRWNMTNLGVGNRLALAAGLRDWCKVLCSTLFSNIHSILCMLLNIHSILCMLRIGVKIDTIVSIF